VYEAGSTNADRFARGTRLSRANRCQEALDEFRAVYGDAEASGDTRLMAASLCEMAWSCYKLGEAEQGLECATGARWLWQREDNQPELARSLAIEAILFLDLGFSDEAYDQVNRALAIAEVADDEAVLAFVLNAKGIVLAVCREAELSIALTSRAVSIAERLSNPAAQAFYLLIQGFAHAKRAEEAVALEQLGLANAERETAIELTEQAIALADASGDRWTQRVGLGNCAEFFGLRGQYERALACLEQSAALPGDPGISLHIHYLYSLGDVLQRIGRLDEARAAVSEALALADGTGQLDHQVNAAGKLGDILEALGDTQAALAIQKRFHALYVRQSGETARRRARIEEIRAETAALRSRAALLADQAMSDALTGIANRRSFDHILNRLAGTSFAVAIVDLDHFKTINDRFSHIVGDVVLQRVARTLLEQIGTHGHAARLGGEEFALVFPDAAIATAASVCEGVRIAIAATDWSAIEPGLAVTVSIGLAAGDGEQPSGALMQRADRRLYAAKANGRNCVVYTDAAPLAKPA